MMPWHYWFSFSGDNKAISEEHTSIPEPVETVTKNEDVFIAFARVFSGCLKKGQEVYVLGPKHNPAQALDIVCYIYYYLF